MTTIQDTEQSERTHDEPARTWRLTPAEFQATKAKLAKVRSRATKRGFTGDIEIVGTTVEVTVTSAGGVDTTQVFIDTRITGQAPRHAGWEFLAAVDSVEQADGTTGLVTRSAAGVDLPAGSREILRPGACGHCGTNRRRSATFLVRHTGTGELMQVGKSCLKDFTGHDTTPVFIDLDAVAPDQGMGGVGSSRPAYSVTTILDLAWRVTRCLGYVPTSWYDKQSTRDAVSAYLEGVTQRDAELRCAVDAFTTEHHVDAHKGGEIAAAVLADLASQTGDYATNMVTALGAAWVEPKQMGLVVSAVRAFEKLTEQSAQAAAPKTPAVFAGTVGDKLTVTGSILRVFAFDNDFRGTTYAITVRDDVTNPAAPVLAVMFTSAGWAADAEPGQEVTLTGTVKRHQVSDRTGDAETVLTRPKLVG